MKALHLAPLLLLVPSSLCAPPVAARGVHAKVRMDALKTLTFYSGEMTAGRRTSPQPQLECKGSPCRYAAPDVVSCKSLGGGEWKCEADLPTSARMGRVQVSCEGWSNSDDPYVLKDSCSLTYTLLPAYPTHGSHKDPTYREKSLLDTMFTLVFWGVFLFIAFNLLASFFRRNAPTPGAPGRRGWGGWGGFGPGGGGGGGGGGPPPPYMKDEPGAAPGAAPGQAGWRPGFWTGLGLGGVAAAAGNALRNANAGQTYVEPRGGWGRPGYDARDRWEDEHGRFGGAAGRGYGAAGPSRFGGGGGGGGDSGETHRSAGFGGTRNR